MKKRGWFGERFKIAVGGSLVALVVLAAIFAPLIAPWDPYQQDLMARLKPGFWSANAAPGHLLGTDNYGRDLLSRLIYGSRLSILVGVSSMLLSALIGSVAGVIAGLRGGATEQAIMRFADAQMAFPDILLAILMVAALGGNALNLILVLGISRWMVYARIVFGLTRTLRQRPFVEAATLYGGGDGYIMRRHILPQVMPVLIVVATLQVAQMILQETALSFLGLGIPPPAATWGNILAEGSTRLFIAPWIANLAGLAIIALVWGVNMLGNGLREHYDPRMVGQ
ncbi:MAG: peptide/nickel transport system permease protein [Rhodospirillaceae bacterium]|jgi:peptide/nickel transport system permease protein|nr:peptide/nickel transport system permease protein [Rhodospirillaceae bacterium]